MILTDLNPAVCIAWRSEFKKNAASSQDEFPHVKIVPGRFEEIVKYDCLVSPANSFGLMDGGIDAAIIAYFGEALMRRVQQFILKRYLGEQPVGTSLIVPTENSRHPFLAHTPTMRVPMPIDRTDNVYQAMWAMLLAVREHNLVNLDDPIETIACPGLGTGTGMMSPAEAARQMFLAYYNFLNPPDTLDWRTAMTRQEHIRFGGNTMPLPVRHK